MSIVAATQRPTIVRVSKGHRAYERTKVASSFTVTLKDRYTLREICRVPCGTLGRAPESAIDQAGLRVRALGTLDALSYATLPQTGVRLGCVRVRIVRR